MGLSSKARRKLSRAARRIATYEARPEQAAHDKRLYSAWSHLRTANHVREGQGIDGCEHRVMRDDGVWHEKHTLIGRTTITSRAPSGLRGVFLDKRIP